MEEEDNKRNVFYLAQNETDGILIGQDGFHRYYEPLPGLRRTVPLPGAMNASTWSVLRLLRDREGEEWTEVVDNDKPGIYCRLSERFFLLGRGTAGDMRVMLNLVAEVIQLEERVILFQMLHYNEGKEWGELLMNDGRLMKFELDSVGNTMKSKWGKAKVSHTIPLETLLKMTNEANEIGLNASGSPSFSGGGKRSILMSYVTGEPFIIHTEGPLKWSHNQMGGASHSLYDRFVKLSHREVL